MAKKSKADYKIKSSHGEKIFRVANIIFMCLLCVITIYPLFYILIYSLNEGTDSLRGGLYLFRGFLQPLILNMSSVTVLLKIRIWLRLEGPY